jgi:hypothetical protein
VKRMRRQLLITAGVCLLLALAGLGVMFDVTRKLTKTKGVFA